jgi:hypothetical protein
VRELESALELRFVDVTAEPFEIGLAHLRTYLECEGHARVPQRYRTDDGYALWALMASDTVTRAMVRPSSTEPGNVEVIVAGPTGGAPVDAAAVAAAIAPKVPTCITASVEQASEANITLSGAVKVRAGMLTVAQGDVERRVAAFSASVPIGGVPVGSERIVSREALIAQVMAAAGVLDFDPVLPADDVPILATQIPTIALSLTWSEA